MTFHVLVTGPVNGPESYLEAAREAGWEATLWPLVQVVPLDVDPAKDIDGLPGVIAVTSVNALPALARAARSLPELLSVPLAAVGRNTAARAREHGFKLAFDPALSAFELGGKVLAAVAPGTRVLWPRGSLAQPLGEQLRGGGLQVDDPVVYETHALEHSGNAPETNAIFFASPSAVRAFASGGGTLPKHVIAIGGATLEALAEEGAEAVALTEPTPSAFRTCLEGLRTAD